MSMRQVIRTLAVAMLLVCLIQGGWSQDVQGDWTNAAAAVINAAFNTLPDPTFIRRDVLLIRANARLSEAHVSLREESNWRRVLLAGDSQDPERQEAIEDLIRANAKTPRLDAWKPLLDRTISLVEEDVLNEVFADSPAEGWRRFEERFPWARALITMSLPGLSRSGNTAVIYIAFERGPLTASGDIYVFRRKAGVWELDGRLGLGWGS